MMLTISDPISEVVVVSGSEHNVARINSIKKLYPDQRQQSKSPTFALTYQGTFMTLMTNCGFSEELAKSVEASYHKLYVVSDKWVQDRLDEAAKLGYAVLAFGLRLRTPLMRQVIMGISKTPYEAAAEGRTAGNALGQSWCMLNSRAGSEFMGKVRKSEQRRNIKPCSQIHDAGYFLIRDNMKTVLYTNEHLSKAVQWQDYPLIEHEHIKMRGELSIFHPNWAHKFDLPNECDEDKVKALSKKHLKDLAEGKA